MNNTTFPDVEILIRINGYHSDYVHCGELNGEIKIEELKEFIQAGIRAYEDEHPRI